MLYRFLFLFFASLLLSVPALATEDKITSATSAAPSSISNKATVMDWDDTILRKGTNRWTCLPDRPDTPGNDPMCLDENGMAWAHAWMTKAQPPEGKIGFAYMLQGGSDASNEDPHATEPAQGQEWVDTGPHVMVFNVGEMVQDYPSQKDNPDTSQPYVMWPGTPYEHLMIPVE